MSTPFIRIMGQCFSIHGVARFTRIQMPKKQPGSQMQYIEERAMFVSTSRLSAFRILTFRVIT